ncbi:TRAP transporter substrate-binding protein [Shumkonia mesophila]|uniref:TRAP transporter substrate-binding protein n=1 Tax=Shumkonia mesophila TaxID=2838854 RepID=UPI0029351D0A|nr:TRAP transporter substrate-binding protein [Shumkonia mesophila]
MQSKFFVTLPTFVLGTALVLGGALTGGAAAQAAGPIVIKADQGAAASGPWQRAMEKLRDIVESKTNGQLKIEIYPDGVLTNGNLRTTIQMLQSGGIQMGLFLPAFYEGFDPRWQVFSLPYLFKDNQAAYNTCDSDVGQFMLYTLEKKKIKGLSLWQQGFRELTTAKKIVRVPADMAGMKMRVMGSPMFISMIKGFGANPTATSMGELFTALQQGVVDGQENPINTIYLRRFYEVQKYLTLTHHVWSPLILAMSGSFFDGLSPQMQKILLDAAEEVKPFQRQFVREDDEKMTTELRKKMEVIELTDAEMKVWKEETKRVHEEVADKIGRDLVNRFYKAAGY